MQAEQKRKRERDGDVDGESNQSAEDREDGEASRGDQEADEGYAGYSEAASDLSRLVDVLWVTSTRELIYLLIVMLLCVNVSSFCIYCIPFYSRRLLVSHDTMFQPSSQALP
jgi:Subunit 11 of the general transcription factor TFIIH